LWHLLGGSETSIVQSDETRSGPIILGIASHRLRRRHQPISANHEAF